LTERFDQALVFASQVHRQQFRKETTIPYVSHLLAVCALVLESGGTEDQAIAALLHDAPEDQGGAAMLERIRHEFGEAVGRLVEQCGEPLEPQKSSWRHRKEAFMRHLASVPAEPLLIIVADKIHNLSCILEEHRRCGDAVFERFGGRKDGTLWYYGRLSEVLSSRAPEPLARRLAELVVKLQALDAGDR
jgi:(p)ppGpp synthase/HD superfamily hydrolase